MYSNKANVLELVALLKKHVTTVVLCPGSRNIPLVQSLANDPDFSCYSITDERSAGFFALGLALQKGKPVAVCCTSGSALLNLHPAVSEAFYQQLPLLVISADRPAAWIGQMDGQTLPQAHVFGSLVKYSVDLPEVKDATDAWLCNRLINEALLALEYQVPGPVQINVPISEPFFSFDVPKLPTVREIKRYEPVNFAKFVAELQQSCNLIKPNPTKLTPTLPQSKQLEQIRQSQQPQQPPVKQPEPTAELTPLANLSLACKIALCHYPQIMLIVGQHAYGASLMHGLSDTERKLITDKVLVVDESLSNLEAPCTCRNIDRVLVLPQAQADTELHPQIVISLGGHIISKRLKHYLRAHRPAMHWHIASDGAIVDLYHGLTHVLVCRPQNFMQALGKAVCEIEQSKSTAPAPQAALQTAATSQTAAAAQTTLTSPAIGRFSGNHVKNVAYPKKWMYYSQQVFEPRFAYSQMLAIGMVIQSLPQGSALHLANSSTVRYAQMFRMPPGIKVMSNRGVNGIEGSMSTAIGYAAADPKQLNFILMGDLSFFYDLNATWNSHVSSNVRILLLNNQGGEIFHALPNLKLTPQAQRYVTATHSASAQGWIESQGFTYMAAHNQDELNQAIGKFMEPLAQLNTAESQASQENSKPILLEVFTSQADDTKILKDYMRQLQNL